jgi:tRNA (mo5U34)-methyltransferase
MTTSSSLARRIHELGPWFHNLILDGIPTAPEHALGDFPRTKLERFAKLLPADLKGKSVLDIGCNAGFYSFEMARRGAARVVGIDSDRRYLAQARLASEVYGISLELRELDVYRVTELREQFDVVLFMGVLYHLRHPLLALDRIHDHVARDLLVFQSLLRGPDTVAPVAPDYPFAETTIFERPDHPAMYFVERSYANDWTNWWIPNRAGAEAMLRSAGFALEARAHDVYMCRRQARRSVESDAEVVP